MRTGRGQRVCAETFPGRAEQKVLLSRGTCACAFRQVGGGGQVEGIYSARVERDCEFLFSLHNRVSSFLSYSINLSYGAFTEGKRLNSLLRRKSRMTEKWVIVTHTAASTRQSPSSGQGYLPSSP